MSMDVFQQATKNFDMESITIGGGEPTLHPDFTDILMHFIGEKIRPFIVTNGTIKKYAKMLHALTVAGVVDARLSYDQYHNMDMVDNEIFELYYNSDMLWGSGKRAISSISKSGRAKNIDGASNCCPCDTHIIKPNGDIVLCGCEDSPIIGNVWTGITEEKYDFYDCIKRYYNDKIGIGI